MRPSPDIALVPIEKRFDEDGKPACAECPFWNDIDGCAVSGTTGTSMTVQIPGISCPVHSDYWTERAL